jgi:hypothetical protein
MRGRKNPISLDEIRESGIEHNVGYNIRDFRVISIKDQHHSTVGKIELIPESEIDTTSKITKVSFKIHTTVPREDSRSTEPYEILHRREEANLIALTRTPSTRPMVPKYLGRITRREDERYVFFTEDLGEISAREEFQSLEDRLRGGRNKRAKTIVEGTKRNMLRERAKNIAKFNGRCHAHRTQIIGNFHGFIEEPLDACINKRKLQEKRFVKYAAIVDHYWNVRKRGKSQEKLDTDEKIEEYIEVMNNKRFGFDFKAKVRDIFEKLYVALGITTDPRSRIRLQFGDCRLQHDFNGRFCDLEDFGYYPWYQDLMTYTSAEISIPRINDIPRFIVDYLLYNKAYSSKSGTHTISDIEERGKLKHQRETEKLLSESFDREEIADFSMGYITGLLIENCLIQDGINKKYSRRLLRHFYPGLHINEIHTMKMERTKAIYHNIISESGGFRLPLVYCSNRRLMKECLYEIGNIMREISPTEIPGLDKLANGRSSAWSGIL